MTDSKWLIAEGDSTTIDVEQVRALKIGVVGGTVDVMASDSPVTRIEVRSVRGKDLKVTLEDGTLEIDHVQLRWDNFIEAFKDVANRASVEIAISAPPQVALKLGTVSASALVSGFESEGKMSSVNGEIVVDHHRGNVEFNAVSGELTAGDHEGRVRAHSVSGDVTVTGVITEFSADTVSGDIVVDAANQPSAISTNTVSGDLTVRFAGNDAHLRVNSVGGKIVVDNDAISGSFGRAFERSYGTLSGDWLDLNASTVSGKVAIFNSNRPSTVASA